MSQRSWARAGVLGAGTTVTDGAALPYNQCNAFAGRKILNWADLSSSRLVDAFATALPSVNRMRTAVESTTEAKLDRSVNAALQRSTDETDATARFSTPWTTAASLP